MVTDTQILSLLYMLDKRIEEIQEEFSRFQLECGPILEYDILNDRHISIRCGFTDYEEGCDAQFDIVFSNDIVVKEDTAGYSVYCGDYTNTNEITFVDFDSFENFAKEQFI